MNLLLLEFNLGAMRLAEVVNAYELGNDILLPAGELAKLLTIGVTVDQASKTASGFVIKEDQPFRLDPASGTVILPGGPERYDQELVRWIDGDLYIASRLLQRWWPVDFKLDLASLRLDVVSREKLPLQARMEREQKAKRTKSQAKSEQIYPYVRLPYDVASLPFIDNTLSFDLRESGGQIVTNLAYSGLLTGDLLGMEAAAFLAISKQDSKPKARVTLARHDPDAGLLGPLQARSVMLGNIGVPAFENVLRGSGAGNGMLVSNRPLGLPTSYRSQTLRGELPPGWDVTLYINDALIAFQQARSDGRYEFPDLPLAYGSNEFRLVFNGPLGQTRVERQTFQLDQTLTTPGELLYTFAVQGADRGGVREILQLDFGASKDINLRLGGVFGDDGSVGRGYANAGARAAVLNSMVNIDHVREISGGSLTEVGIQTSLNGFSVDAHRIWLDDFQSEFFTKRTDPLEVRDEIRIAGNISVGKQFKLPVALDIQRERYASGGQALEVQQRLSLNLLGTSVTNLLDWRSAKGPDRVGGVLQASRRVAGVGMSGQAIYILRPKARLNSFALSADKNMGRSTRINLGVLHEFETRQTVGTAGLSRNFGAFGLGVSGMFGGRSNYAVGLQVFAAIGQNPSSGRIISDWRPLAASGLLAAQVFIDDNQNGIFDKGEDPVEGVGFNINGGRSQVVRTDADGSVLLSRLTPNAATDISIDIATLQDAQLQPSVAGVRLLPRPGKIQKINFPLVMTGEIDGTVYLIEDGKSRGIGNAVVELVNSHGEIVSSTRSSGDGFYVLAGVKPGAYSVQISSSQLDDLDVIAAGEAAVTMPPDPDFISGVNFTLRKRTPS
ncbi:MAG: MSCRAMM family protein [Sphingobium sp.]